MHSETKTVRMNYRGKWNKHIPYIHHNEVLTRAGSVQTHRKLFIQSDDIRVETKAPKYIKVLFFVCAKVAFQTVRVCMVYPVFA